MKKILVSAILGLAAIASVHAQGTIILYNYSGPDIITYGNQSGGTLGTAVTGGFTVGYYWGAGDQTAALNSSMTATGLIPLTVGSGANSTATIGTDQPGYFSNTSASSVLTGAPGGTAVTIVVVAYNGASYDVSTIRGHSAAFLITPQVSPLSPPIVGDSGLTAFSVAAVPEPSTFALAGLGLASLLIFRRRK